MRLSELCKQIADAQYCYNLLDREINGISYDSRRVRKGDLFVAIRGTKADGHDFIIDALMQGAAAVVTQRWMTLPGETPQIIVPSSRMALARLSSYLYGKPSDKMEVIGITGTNGKTTTSYLLRSVLEASGKKVGLLGTVCYQTGDRLIPSNHTTPESLELHYMLREMLNSGITHVVMEVSSHALAQKRTCGIDFRAAIFTNLTADHLDYHKDLESYREAKAELFRGLSPGSFAILREEDEASHYFAKVTRAECLWYGFGHASGIKAQVLETTLRGMLLRLSTGEGEVLVSTRLIGRHNLLNILAASTAATAMGLDLETIKKGVESLSLVPGRLERIPSENGHIVFVDYAHSPDALESVLGAIRPLARNRLLLVFGCGGDRDRAKRPIMGGIAERYSDLFWITSDNPRTEDPLKIITEIEKGVQGKGYRVEPNRRQAIEEALSEAKDGDIVLIAGKGHECTQSFADTVVPFDDREVARQILSRPYAEKTKLVAEGEKGVSEENEVSSRRRYIGVS